MDFLQTEETETLSTPTSAMAVSEICWLESPNQELNPQLPKGQLISECLLGVIDFPKNQRKIWQISALESKKINKVRAFSYNIMIYIWLGAVHELCRLKIGDFWPPPPPLNVIFAK